MAWIAVAVGAGSVISGAMAASAAGDAADAQSQSAANQIAESRRQFDEIQKLLQPYTNAGPAALSQQQALIGLQGPGAQYEAIQGVQGSPQFAAMMQQGENAILQNASATGGLRGGNTQAALAQFRPQMLNQLIDQQYQRLSGLTTIGQNSAAGVGAAGQNATNSINSAYQQQGAAQAGNALAQGKAGNSLISGLAQAAGTAYGNWNNTPADTGFYQPNTAGVSSTGGFTSTPMFADTSGFGGLGSGFY